MWSASKANAVSFISQRDETRIRTATNCRSSRALRRRRVSFATPATLPTRSCDARDRRHEVLRFTSQYNVYVSCVSVSGEKKILISYNFNTRDIWYYATYIYIYIYRLSDALHGVHRITVETEIYAFFNDLYNGHSTLPWRSVSTRKTEILFTYVDRIFCYIIRSWYSVCVYISQ